MEINLVEVLILVISLYLLFTVIKLNGQVRGLKYSLDQVSKQTGTSNPVDHELNKLLSEGNDVKAVKRVRETLGLSLLEAKQYIDSLKSNKR